MRYMINNSLVTQYQAMRKVGNVANGGYSLFLAGNDGYPWILPLFSINAPNLTVMVNSVNRFWPFAVVIRIDTTNKKIVCDCFDAPPPLRQEYDLVLLERYSNFSPEEKEKIMSFRRLQYEVWRTGEVPPWVDDSEAQKLQTTLSFYKAAQGGR